jgi:hypothetical protein
LLAQHITTKLNARPDAGEMLELSTGQPIA